MQQTKPWYLSKTIWGIIISVLGFVLSQILKVDIQLPESNIVTTADMDIVIKSAMDIKSAQGSFGLIAAKIMVIVGALLSVYGRYKANTKIS